MGVAQKIQAVASSKLRHPVRNRIRNLQWVPIDVLAIALAYMAALNVFLPPVATTHNHIAIFALVGIVNCSTLYAWGVYKRIWSMTSGHDVAIIIKAMALATLILIAIDFFYANSFYLHAILLGNIFTLIGVIAARYRSRLATGISWRWRAVWLQEFPQFTPTTRVLIVGAGEAGQVLAWCLKHRLSQTEQRYEIIGFIDDNPKKLGLFIEGRPILGASTNIVQLCEKYQIDLIAISLHQISGTDFRDLLKYCEKTKARIKLMPDMASLMSNRQADILLRDVQPHDLIGRNTITTSKYVNLAHVSNKITLVTGAAGSIGSELCRQLCAFHTTEIVLLDNNESALHELWVELSTQFPHIKLNLALADITRPLAVRDVFARFKPQVVFHAAAYKHVPLLEQHPEEAVRVNVGGTLCLAEFAIEYDVERFVLISTDKAVNPYSIMGASKRACELTLRALVQRHGESTKFTSVRFGNVLGSRGSVLPTFNHQIDKGGPITVTDREMTRYFMSIPEAVNLVIHAACLTTGNDIFLLRMGEEVRIQELAERMIRLRGLRPYIDIDIKYTGVRPGEKLHEELYSEDEVLKDTVHPNIIQLKDRNESFDGTWYLRQLSDVLYHAPEAAVEDLFRLIRSQKATTTTPPSVPITSPKPDYVTVA